MLYKICVTNDQGYVLLVVTTFRSFPHSWLINGFVNILTRRVTLVEQELLTLPEHQSLPLVVSGVRVTQSLVLYVCFVDRCLSFCPFSFGHCVVCSSSIYGFWLPFWYLQALLILTVKPVHVVISIRQSPFSCPAIENCIWIQSLSRVACLERKLFLCPKGWPFNTGLTIIGDGCDLFCSSV